MLEWDINYEVLSIFLVDVDRVYNLFLNYIFGKLLIVWLKDGFGGNIMNIIFGIFNLLLVDKLVYGGVF